MRFSSVHVVKVSRPSSNQENLMHPWYRLKKRSQSLIYWKKIRHPSVHVQRINRRPSSQERIITPINRTSPTHTLNESYMKTIEVKRFVEDYILIERAITTSTSRTENFALKPLSTPQMCIRVCSVVFIVLKPGVLGPIIQLQR